MKPARCRCMQVSAVASQILQPFGLNTVTNLTLTLQAAMPRPMHDDPARLYRQWSMHTQRLGLANAQRAHAVQDYVVYPTLIVQDCCMHVACLELICMT